MSEQDEAPPPARAAKSHARTTLLVGLVLTLLAWPLCGGASAGSVFVGAVVGSLNAYVFTRTVGASLGRETSRLGRLWALLGPVKLILFLGIVAVLLVGHFVRPLPFLVGYASLPVALTLEMLRRR